LEIKHLTDACLNNVRELLRANRDKLDRLAHALIEKETLHFRDIARILEPGRSEMDIEREALALAEKRIVGKAIELNLEAIRALPIPQRRDRRAHKNGDGNGKNGSGATSDQETKSETTASSASDTEKKDSEDKQSSDEQK